MSISIENFMVRQKMGEKQALRAIKDAGFDCVDYSFYWSEEYHVLDDNYVEYAKDLRKYMDEIGLVCNQTHATFDFQPHMEMSMSCKEYRDTVRSIESSGILGAKCVVVHALKNAHCDDEEYLEINRKFYKSLEEVAKKSGVKIGVENLFYYDKKCECHRGSFGNPKMLSAFVKEMGTDNFCACIDLGHASLVGYEPHDFIDGMDKGLIEALHVQDNDYHGDRHIPPYHGKFDWEKIAESLKNYGYKGEINFEVFWYLSNYPKELLPSALKHVANIGRYLEKKIGLN